MVVGGAFLIFSEVNRLGEEQSTFDQKTAELQRLQRNKPYPDKANVEATEREVDDARKLLGQIAEKFRVQAPSASPQAFQDELARLVKEVAEKAASKNVVLPENFYLGFEQYETQLPSAAAAPALSVQLRSIHAVALLLVDANVKSLGPVVRPPILAEAGPPAEDAPTKKGKQQSSDEPRLEFAPFDISFGAEQPAFRLAFNRILELNPPVFLRLLSLENSAPSAPSKSAGAEEGQEQVPPTGAIRPVVGRESVNVSMRMASVVPTPSSPN